jgi:hypothetical protein
LADGAGARLDDSPSTWTDDGIDDCVVDGRDDIALLVPATWICRVTVRVTGLVTVWTVWLVTIWTVWLVTVRVAAVVAVVVPTCVVCCVVFVVTVVGGAVTVVVVTGGVVAERQCEMLNWPDQPLGTTAVASVTLTAVKSTVIE